MFEIRFLTLFFGKDCFGYPRPFVLPGECQVCVLCFCEEWHLIFKRWLHRICRLLLPVILVIFKILIPWFMSMKKHWTFQVSSSVFLWLFKILILVVFCFLGWISFNVVYRCYYYMVIQMGLFLWFLFNFLNKRYMSVLPVCMTGTYRGQKRTSAPLELQLQMIMSCCVHTGNWIPGPSWREVSALNHCVISPALMTSFSVLSLLVCRKDIIF